MAMVKFLVQKPSSSCEGEGAQCYCDLKSAKMQIQHEKEKLLQNLLNQSFKFGSKTNQ